MRYIEKHTTMTSADFSRLALLLAFRMDTHMMQKTLKKSLRKILLG